MPADFRQSRALHAAPRRDLFDRGEDAGNRPVARRVITGADIEREFANARDDIDGALQHREQADGADQRRRCATAPLNRQHDFSRGGHGIVTEQHQHRTGMADGAADRLRESARRRQSMSRCRAADRVAAAPRPLFDVRLRHSPRSVSGRRAIVLILPRDRRPRLAAAEPNVDAVRIAALQGARIEPAGDSARCRYKARRTARPPLRQSRPRQDETADADLLAANIRRRRVPVSTPSRSSKRPASTTVS